MPEPKNQNPPPPEDLVAFSRTEADWDRLAAYESHWRAESHFWPLSEMRRSLEQKTTRLSWHATTGEVYGFCMYTLVPVQQTVQSELLFVYVPKKHRGHGYGTVLLEGWIAECSSTGLSVAMRLEVKPQLSTAIGLYERQGFTQVAVRKAYYQTGEDALIMSRTLG